MSGGSESSTDGSVTEGFGVSSAAAGGAPSRISATRPSSGRRGPSAHREASASAASSPGSC